MIVYCAVAATLLLALFSLFMARRTGGHAAGNCHRALLAVSSAVFLWLFGPWVFITIYARYVFAAVFLVVLLVPFFSARARPVQHPAGWRVIGNLFLAGVFSVLSLLYFTGTTGRPYGVARLSLPFRKGTYFVFQGGRGLPTNVFHFSLRGTVLAMDLVKLNSFGNRARKVCSENLNDYEIYNDTLYSPCSGRIVHTETINPDNIPPSRKRGPTNTNQVLINTGSMYVFMAHLRPGCVFVHAGDSVVAGQPIACCGNSGFSLEPHLHIQAQTNSHTGLPWYKEKPLLIEFGGKYYGLFQEIQAK